MPNTLAHMGVQALATRAAVPGAAPGWIWLGCIIPDLPWIGQRAARMLLPDLSPIDVRLFAVAQSSLLFCLVAAGAFACLARRPGQVFAVLSLGAVLHLALDATQTKWGNGVVLLLPFDWRVVNAGLYWPEDLATLLLTVLGGGVFLWAALRWRGSDARGAGHRRPWLAAGMAAVWLLGPLAAMGALERAGAHGADVLRETDRREGRAIAFDRARLLPDADGTARLHVWTGEALDIQGLATDPPAGTVSVRGRFTGPAALRVEALHVHRAGWRDAMSYLGLALAMLWWMAEGFRRMRH